MKAILEFNLPEEEPEFRDAINGGKWKHVVWTLDQSLRSDIKYGSDSLSDHDRDLLQHVRDELYRIMSQNSVDLDI